MEESSSAEDKTCTFREKAGEVGGKAGEVEGGKAWKWK